MVAQAVRNQVFNKMEALIMLSMCYSDKQGVESIVIIKRESI